MSAHKRFTIEIYGFTHSLHTFLAHCHSWYMVPLQRRTRRIQQARERVQRYRKRLTTKQWDVRQQDNNDRGQLAPQHLSN